MGKPDDKLTALVPAPSMKNRPRCHSCGKRLQPRYDSKEVKTDKTRKVYERLGYDGRRPVFSDDDNARQDAKGRWYVEEKVRSVERSWDGNYHGIAEEFCCGRCATRWAASVCKKLRSEGRELWLSKALEVLNKEAACTPVK